MATTTLAVVDQILKEVYEDRVRDQLQSEVITLKRIEQSSEGVTSDVGGKYVVFPIRTRRNHGIGARAENTPLPTARSQKYAAARVSLAYLYGTAELTGQTMELANKNFQAFASALQQELDGLKQVLVKDTNRQTYGTSTGILATANGAGTTTTFVCADSEALYLEIGMIVDIFRAGIAATGGPFEISNITSTAGTTTVTFIQTSGQASAAADTLHRTGSRNLETIGLKQIIDNTGVLYNVDPAVEPVWKAVVANNGGVNRALSEGLMIKLTDDIRKNGGKTSVIFTSLGMRRAYFNLLVQQRRYTNTEQFDGGFEGLGFDTDWGSVPIVADFDCQQNRMYFVNEGELKLYRDNDWSFMNRDGSNWQRKVDVNGTYDVYTTIMYRYMQLGTHRRNSHGILSDLTEAS